MTSINVIRDTCFSVVVEDLRGGDKCRRHCHCIVAMVVVTGDR